MCRYCGRDLIEIVLDSSNEIKRARELGEELNVIVRGYQETPMAMWDAVMKIYQESGKLAAQTENEQLREVLVFL